jgi:Asp-tRNA(Asn)/Glu-tRNA(Gln) amidotransferase A subunit family amidase
MKKLQHIVIVLLLTTNCFGQSPKDTLSTKQLEIAEQLTGLAFTEEERTLMLPDVQENLVRYYAMRQVPIPNHVPLALDFNPVPAGVTFSKVQYPMVWDLPANVSVPKNREELAFYSIAELAVLIKNKKISSTELTKIYLNRLKRYGDTLQCVVAVLEDTALEQAKAADAEIASGKYRGMLHGIPYGVKDLLAVKGTKTTWGTTPYKDQTIEQTATVVKKLEEAGAVLVAKLTLGALARGDVWFGGMTKNPWNLKQGSSGSSAGSASATVAGLVAFAIGTETLGSIVSPSTRCGATGLRPTYGRVSRNGAMALSWSMDKIGPICRSAEDCAIVFQAIIGVDVQEQSTVDFPFNYNASTPLKDLRIGYLKTYFEENYPSKKQDSLALEALESLGAQLIPVALPNDFDVSVLRIILTVESAAAFDELTRSNLDTLMEQQNRFAWPNTFRQSRFVPAVEYIQANRLRYQLIQQMHEVMKNFDVVVSPSFAGNQLLITNLTGHPCVVVPNADQTSSAPSSISFIGNLYDEGKLLTIARAYQKVTRFEEIKPPFFRVDGAN